jgi:hypothetical protein
MACPYNVSVVDSDFGINYFVIGGFIWRIVEDAGEEAAEDVQDVPRGV